MDLFELPWKQDLRFFLDSGKDVVLESFSVYTPVDLYRNDRVSGKTKNDLYFSGKYFSPYPISGVEKQETDGKVYCLEYSKFPFGRVSHFLVLYLLSTGAIDGYFIDERRREIIGETGRAIRQDDIEAIGQAASKHFLSGGVKYILETAKVGNCANVIELR